MKTLSIVVLIAILVFRCEASVFDEAVEQVSCVSPPTPQCLGRGASCGKSQACASCQSTFDSCYLAATTPEAYCTCFQNAVACYNNANDQNCLASSLHQNCQSFFASQSASCSCGTPGPAPPAKQCAANYYCEPSTSTCLEKKPINARCTSSEECGDPKDPFDTSYTCQSNYWCQYSSTRKGMGSNCTSNTQCLSNNCDSVARVCVGLTPSDGACSSSAPCAFGFYCSTSTSRCVAKKKKDDFCTTSIECAQGLSCSFSKCIDQLSVVAGGRCSQNDQCAAGLLCDQGTLTCKSDYDRVPCTNSTHCLNLGYDSCACKNGQQVCTQNDYKSDPSCTNVFKAMLTCANAHGCPILEASLRADSCSMRFCGKETPCYLNCLAKSKIQSLGVCAVAPDNTICENEQSSSSMITFSAISVAILGMIALLF